MLLEQIISKLNMELAYARVVSNKGAEGVNGVEAGNFAGQLKAVWATIRTGSVFEGSRVHKSERHHNPTENC